MRAPNPDPHPERADAMDDVSPERIVWRQIDRFLQAESVHDERAMHGALEGLSALVSGLKDNGYETEIASIMEHNGFEERAHLQFEAIIRLLDAKGKWLKTVRKDVDPGTEWRQGFQ